jgi:hypothetical protein
MRKDGLFGIIIITGFADLTAVTVTNLSFWLVRRKTADGLKNPIASICRSQTREKNARKKAVLGIYFVLVSCLA